MTSQSSAGTQGRKRSPRPGDNATPTQLRLLDGGRTSTRAWQLDARTRRIGRERVAEAREILRRAQPPQPRAIAPRDKIAG